MLDRSRELIDEILGPGRTGDISEARKCEAFPLQATIQRVLSTYRSILDQLDIQVEKVLPTEPVTVLGDPTLTERVVENVLGNALKVSPRGGTIVIQVYPESDGFVNLRILDEGPGIPPSLIDTMFEPFESDGKAHEVMPKGIGLGLTFCRSAMRAQGGRIQVEDHKGGGAAVTISLPTPS